MELSGRLKMVASLVTEGSRVADLGTDHAYIPIFLVLEGKSPSAIAMDVKQGPLQRAEEHIKEAGLADTVSVRLSDGLQNLGINEADAAVLAGMGGTLMIRILQNHWETTVSLKECILQPQSEVAAVRAFLLEKGFSFLEEEMVYEDGKYYPMMKVKPPVPAFISVLENATAQGKSNGKSMRKQCTGVEKLNVAESWGWNETEIRFGKYLLEKQHPVLKQFLEREEELYTRILSRLEQSAGERIEKRKEEIIKELEYIRKGLGYYDLQRYNQKD